MVSSVAWLCAEPWCGLAWLGGGAGVARTRKAPGLGGGHGLHVHAHAAGHLKPCPFAPRLHKCRLCYKQLKSISGLVRSKSGLSGRHGSAFRELHLLMASLD